MISRVTRLERFIRKRERENFILKSLINFVPMERLKNVIAMMIFRSFGGGTSSNIQDKLKTISMISWKTEQNGVVIVNFRMNENE
jgi:hypothetical protein